MKIWIIPLCMLLLVGCKGPINTIESCKVLKITLYPDGVFKFTPDEIGHLSDANQIKIIAVRKYYRTNCLGMTK